MEQPSHAIKRSADSESGGEEENRCFEKSIELLGRRSHFKLELENKLRGRGFSKESIDAVVARLERLAYLDDLRCAEEFLGARRRRGAHWGRRRIAAELGRRGAEESVIDACLEAISDADEVAAAHEVARRFRQRRGSQRQALARHLEGQGFGSHAILAVLDDPPSPPSSGSL